MNNIRRERIKEYVERNDVATIKELQAMLPQVSLMTIHRDLDALEQQAGRLAGEAVDYAMAQPQPELSRLLAHVYAEEKEGM